MKTAPYVIKLEVAATGLRFDFERDVVYLIPANSANKRVKGKCPLADISSTTLMKTGQGNSRVEFRHYIPEEYMGLNDDQRCKLKEHHASTDNMRLSKKFKLPKQPEQGGGKKNIQESTKSDKQHCSNHCYPT